MPRCPVCSQPVQLEDNPLVPFCSERCRLIDLGHWLDESYGLPAPARDDDEEGADGELPPDQA